MNTTTSQELQAVAEVEDQRCLTFLNMTDAKVNKTT